MATNSARSFQLFTSSETSNVRFVDDQMLLLEQDRTPLYVLTNNAKRKEPTYSPRIEWFEDADLGMIGTVSNGTTDYASNATGIFVQDVTLFGVNDVVSISKTNASATLEELVQVTAVSGTSSGTLTITRGFAGSSADTISATNVIKIISNVQSESGAIQNPRSSIAAPKTSGAQIFEWLVQISRTAAATKVYTAKDGKDRARQQVMGMRRQKIEIENAGLFGNFSESLNGANSVWSSMGVRSIISTYNTDGGGTLTYSTFLNHSEGAFRYGAPEKLLIAAPRVKTALDFFCANKQFTSTEDKQFGVSLKRFQTSNGTWLLANNYNMDGGYADEALGIDLSAVWWCPLVNNGINCDTQIIQNYDTTNPKVIKDLVTTQGGWMIKHQKRHSRLYDVASYQ